MRSSPSGVSLGFTHTIPRAILALGAIIALVLLGSRLDFVPIWDGWAYSECAVDVATNRFALYFLRCYGHPAYLYSGLLGAVQLLDVGSPVLLFLVNAVVLAVTSVGFFRLMHRAFPGGGHDTEIAILTTTLVLQPAFLASVVQPSLDLPVLAGTVWCVLLLVERRWLWCAAVGMAMSFSKETGVLLYAVVLGCYVMWLVARTKGALAARLRACLPLVPTLAPFVAYAGYVLAFRMMRPGQAAVWEASGNIPLGMKLFRVDREVASYAALLFVLNFAWVPTAWVVADGIRAVGRIVQRRRPAWSVAGGDPFVIGFLTLAAGGSLLALTRFTTYSNPRYLMAGTALLLGLAYVALVRLAPSGTVRRVALAAYGSLLVLSAVRTVDPLSRWLWGTFPFGSHRMLAMTTLTGECCGAGRDQLTYSLEFTRFHELTDSVVATLLRDTATVIALPSWMRYHAVGRIDRATWRRTLRRDGAFEPTVMTAPVMLIRNPPPPSAIYIAMPNATDSTSLAELAGVYDVGPERRFESGGYAVAAYPLHLRGLGPASQPAVALVRLRPTGSASKSR